MSKRRRFSGELKAKIALEALRGDRTLQEIASKHQVHPNQVSTWKRQAIDGLGEVFSNGGERRRRDHESEIRDLHAKIGALDPSRKSGGALHRLHCFCLEFDGACEVQRRVPTDWIIEPIDVSGHGSFSLAS